MESSFSLDSFGRLPIEAPHCGGGGGGAGAAKASAKQLNIKLMHAGSPQVRRAGRAWCRRLAALPPPRF